jgi:hypothetical protein
LVENVRSLFPARKLGEGGEKSSERPRKSAETWGKPFSPPGISSGTKRKASGNREKSSGRPGKLPSPPGKSSRTEGKSSSPEGISSGAKGKPSGSRGKSPGSRGKRLSPRGNLLGAGESHGGSGECSRGRREGLRRREENRFPLRESHWASGENRRAPGENPPGTRVSVRGSVRIRQATDPSQVRLGPGEDKAPIPGHAVEPGGEDVVVVVSAESAPRSGAWQELKGMIGAKRFENGQNLTSLSRS